MNILEKYRTYVWPKIVEFLNDNSQAKYTHQGWYGPCIWSEDGDIKRIITRFCKYGVAILVDQGDKKGKNYILDRKKEVKELEAKFSPVVPLIWQYEKL